MRNAALKGWMESQPTGVAGPAADAAVQSHRPGIRDLADFLLWTNKIRTQNWPPNDAG
jgi:nitric oxide reductase subunit C